MNEFTASTWAALERALSAFEPPPDLRPSEWAEQSVHIPMGNALPGLISFDNAPYQREPLDMTENPECERISLMWSAQVGKTQLALCAQGFWIEQNPTPQIMVQPSITDLNVWMETKFNPLVETNAGLEQAIAKPRGREGVNNRTMKSYPGGFIMFSWSGSPKTMRGRSAPKIVADEVDGYDRTSEGHPVSLVSERAKTFGDQKTILEISTPTFKGSSYIEAAYFQGDQRQYYVACPHCDHLQTLRWANVKWDKELNGEIISSDIEKTPEGAIHLPHSARYLCTECGALWNDVERIKAIREADKHGGGWKASKPFRGHASYHLNELYSCFGRLRDTVQSFLNKKAAGDLQTFFNTALAETWEEQGDKVDTKILMDRAEDYKAQVPSGAVVLTAGIDTQPDRLEIEVVGWGLGEESWAIENHVIYGDPDAKVAAEGDLTVWDELDEYLAQTFQHESGLPIHITAAAFDTGGQNTQAAYDYAKRVRRQKKFALKGGNRWNMPIVSAPSRKSSGRKGRKFDLYIVGVNDAKLTIMRRFNIEKPGPGYCHFNTNLSPEYFDQITAEQLITKYQKGERILEWHKIRQRNEMLDCRVYAYAALLLSRARIDLVAKRFEVESRTNDVEDPDPAKNVMADPPEKNESKRKKPRPPNSRRRNKFTDI